MLHVTRALLQRLPDDLPRPLGPDALLLTSHPPPDWPPPPQHKQYKAILDEQYNAQLLRKGWAPAKSSSSIAAATAARAGSSSAALSTQPQAGSSTQASILGLATERSSLGGFGGDASARSGAAGAGSSRARHEYGGSARERDGGFAAAPAVTDGPTDALGDPLDDGHYLKRCVLSL